MVEDVLDYIAIKVYPLISFAWIALYILSDDGKLANILKKRKSLFIPGASIFVFFVMSRGLTFFFRAPNSESSILVGWITLISTFIALFALAYLYRDYESPSRVDVSALRDIEELSPYSREDNGDIKRFPSQESAVRAIESTAVNALYFVNKYRKGERLAIDIAESVYIQATIQIHACETIDTLQREYEKSMVRQKKLEGGDYPPQ